MAEHDVPPDKQGNDYWFKKMVVDKLHDLAEVQKSIQSSQQAMHAANQAKDDEIVAAINTIKLDVNSFKLVRQVVFTGIGTVLLTLLAAMLALVLKTGKVW